MSFTEALSKAGTDAAKREARRDYFRDQWRAMLATIAVELEPHTPVLKYVDPYGWPALHVAEISRHITVNNTENNAITWEFSLTREEPYQYLSAFGEGHHWCSKERIFELVARDLTWRRDRKARS